MLIGLLPTPILNNSSALPEILERINGYMLHGNICKSVFRPTFIVSQNRSAPQEISTEGIILMNMLA